MTTAPSKPNRGKSAGGLDEELLAMLKYLRLRKLLSAWDETLEKAVLSVTTFLSFLSEFSALLTTQCIGRLRRRMYRHFVSCYHRLFKPEMSLCDIIGACPTSQLRLALLR